MVSAFSVPKSKRCKLYYDFRIKTIHCPWSWAIQVSTLLNLVHKIVQKLSKKLIHSIGFHSFNAASEKMAEKIINL